MRIRTKCKICGSEAAVYLPYANTRFCSKHFIEYFARRVEKTIKKYKMIGPGDKVLVAVSGGKDSIALLDVLNMLSGKLGFEIQGLTLDLGISGYSDKYVEVAKAFYEKINIKYDIISIKNSYGFTIDDVARIRRKVCAYCGLVKRYVINRYAWERGFDAVATGHNMDDLLGNALFTLMRGDMDSLAKIKPVLPGRDGLVKRIRPLAFTREKDVKLYVCIKRLPVVKDKCPYSTGATSSVFKHKVNELEERFPSIKYSFARTVYDKIMLQSASHQEVLNRCKICGMPSKGEVCGFCRLRAALGKISL